MALRGKPGEWERQRLQAGVWFERGVSQAEVARRLGVSRTAAMRWYNAWATGGRSGLRGPLRWGPAPQLSGEQWRRIERALRRGPQAWGFSTQYWSLQRIASLIESLTGVRHHPGHVWKLLRARGWSRQKPARQARERDDKAISRWMRTSWRRAKRGARARRAKLVFIDESGFSERPSVLGTWAPRGHPPVLRHRGHWHKVSAIGALVYSAQGIAARAQLKAVPGNVRSEHIVKFLARLHRWLGGPMYLFWDRGQPHRSEVTRQFIEKSRRWLTVVPLPAYAPELNPTEGMWSWLKRVVWGNFCPVDRREVELRIRRGYSRLSRRPSILQSFADRTPLRVCY